MGFVKMAKVTINYKVPSWNFCNSMSRNEMCRFHRKGCCMLYDTPLANDLGQWCKCQECIKATCGIETTIKDSLPVEQEAPKAKQPMSKTLKSCIDIFIKTYKDLREEGIGESYALKIAKEDMFSER